MPTTLDRTTLSDGDYTLSEGAAWLEVKGFAVRVHQTDEGVCVDVYRNGQEDESPLASCYAFDSDAQDCEGERTKLARAGREALDEGIRRKTIRLLGDNYMGLASDGEEVTLGNIQDFEATLEYLATHPTPDFW
jgi:hypothetical protein